MMERNEAIAKGLQTYNTGRPCIHGHEPLRYTKSGICVKCAGINAAKSKRKVDDFAKATIAKQVLVRAWMHPDDAADVLALVTALNANRGIVTPPEQVAPDTRPFAIDPELERLAKISAASKPVLVGTPTMWSSVKVKGQS